MQQCFRGGFPPAGPHTRAREFPFTVRVVQKEAQPGLCCLKHLTFQYIKHQTQSTGFNKSPADHGNKSPNHTRRPHALTHDTSGCVMLRNAASPSSYIMHRGICSVKQLICTSKRREMKGVDEHSFHNFDHPPCLSGQSAESVITHQTTFKANLIVKTCGDYSSMAAGLSLAKLL